jgi:PTH1 family peptidyl-tRNA hydrolase
MWIIVGLGNPGSQYALTRHNIGFLAVDVLFHRYSFSPWREKWNARYSEGQIAGQRVLLLKPQTYMNLSGQSVGAVMQFFKASMDDMLVIHDELDIPPGKMKIKIGGGNGGHNGLRSIDQHIGPTYKRLRIGIGHPGHKDAVSAYVLSSFHKVEISLYEPLLAAMADEFSLLCSNQDALFLTRMAAVIQQQSIL